jgi:hypothetical protein
MAARPAPHSRLIRPSSHNAGVTLVEAAIVLVLMGMLIAGLVAAQQLIAAAKVRSIVREIENKMSGVSTFVDKFRAYPGDMVNAETFFTAAATDNGDGNGRIMYTGGTVTSDEGNLAWQHMQLAGIVEGKFQATGANDILDVNVPRSNAAGGGAGFALNWDTTYGNHLILGLANGSGAIDTPTLTPEASYNVDKKMDDGLPTLGVIRGMPAAGCQNTTPSPAEYNFSNDTLACYLIITLE